MTFKTLEASDFRPGTLIICTDEKTPLLIMGEPSEMHRWPPDSQLICFGWRICEKKPRILWISHGKAWVIHSEESVP